MTRWCALVGIVVLGLVAVTGGSARARGPSVKAEDLVGAWEGLSKGTNGELPIRLDLTYSDGKFGGTVNTPIMLVSIASGSLQGDALTLTLDAQGMTGTLSAKVVPGKIEGSWHVSSETGTVALSRAAATPPASGNDPISGDWTGEATAMGQPMPFTMTLTLRGETVTGEIVGASGRVPLTSGTWKDGTLTIAFTYVGGEPVSMGGKLDGGKLVGVLDYNSGEVQGTWFAARKQ